MSESSKPVTRALAMNEEIIAKVVEKLLTSNQFIDRIADTICNSIARKFEERIKMLEIKVELLTEKCDSLKEEALCANDKLEQYSRKNSLRIIGLPARKDEDTDEAIIQLCNEKLGVSITKADIDCSHRLFSKDSARSPIIVKFCRRTVKNMVFHNKKKIKNTKIVIFEDLTKKRAQLLHRAKEVHGMKNVWTSEGVVLIKVETKIKKKISEVDLPVQ